MILNEGGRGVKGCHKALGCRYCFSRVSREMGPWASGLGVLGNDPGEGNTSHSGHVLLPRGTWQWEVLGTLQEGASLSLPLEVLRSQPRTENLQVSKRSACEVSKILHQLRITLQPWFSSAISPRF